MVESLIALRGFRQVGFRNHVVELTSQPVGVHHLSFGIARMNADTLDKDLSTCSIEILELQLAQVTAIDGVAPFAAKLLHVEMVGTHADFLVRIESHANLSVFYLLMVAQEAHRLYYFGNTSLVVSSQESGPVRNDEVFALVQQQFRKLLRCRYDAWRQFYVCAVVVADDAGLYVLAAGIGTRVVVRDETNRRHLLLRVSLQRSIDITFVVHLHVGEPFTFQFVFQVAGKVKLFRSTGHARRIFSRLRVESSVVDESFR